MQDFDLKRRERSQADRSFRIGGEPFSYRPSVAPEPLMRWTAFTTITEREEARLSAARAQLAAAEASAVVPATRDRLAADPQEYADHLADIARLAEKAADAAAALHQAQEDSDIVHLLDETITAIIEPDQAERWEQVRSADSADPISLQDLQDLLEWLMGQVVNRPTGQPSGSSTPPAAAGTPSTAASSSPVAPAVPED